MINASLKKKDVQTKSSKPKKAWLDKKHKARKKRQNKATSQFGEETKNDVAHAQEASSGGAICPLFPQASTSADAQAEGQVALVSLFPEPSNSGGAQAQAQGGNAQTQVSFTQMLTVICSYKLVYKSRDDNFVLKTLLHLIYRGQ